MVLAVSANADAIYNFTWFDGPGNNGGVVGFSSDNAAAPTLFTNFIRNPNGAFTILPTGGDRLAMANGTNDSLTVVGGNSNGKAFAQTNGVLATLAAVNGTTVFQTALGISHHGLIVGQFTDNANA